MASFSILTSILCLWLLEHVLNVGGASGFSGGFNRTKIIGGETASPHAHPHQVSIQEHFPEGWRPHCGGSIINPQVILTAAHCILDKNASALRVISGVHDLYTVEGTEQVSLVQRADSHPQYNLTTDDLDYGLILLKNPLRLNVNVSIIQMTEIGTKPTGNCVSIGWGNTAREGEVKMAALLQQVDVPIVSHSLCKNNYAPNRTVTEHMICAGGHKNSCHGDSGGSLICWDPDRNGTGKILAGLVSWGAPICGQTQFPGVYADVAHAQFRQWFDEWVLMTMSS